MNKTEIIRKEYINPNPIMPTNKEFYQKLIKGLEKPKVKTLIKASK